MIAHQKNVESLVGRIVDMVSESRGPLDKAQLSALSKQLASGLENLYIATRHVRAVRIFI